MADFILNDDGTFEMADKPKKKKKTIYEEMDEAWQKDRESKKLSNYFQKGAFEDGWQKGDLLKSIGYSTLDAIGNATEGSLRAFEGISDWGRNRGADIVDFFGADDYAKKLRERSKEDDTAAIVDAWNHITAGDISGTKSEEEIGRFKKVNENSVFTDKGDQVFQGVGNSLTSIGVGALSGGTLATPSFVLSAAGNAETEALNNGATAGEARMYGLISGGIEYGSERLFGGLGKTSEKFGLGKGALDDQAVKLFTKNMKSSLMKNITTLGIKSVGEGLEEVASGIGNAFAQKITYMNEEEIGQLLKDQNLMDSFVSGMLSSAIMQSPSTITSTIQGRDVNTGLTRTQQQYVNEIAQQRMVEAQRRNAKLNGYEKGKIEDRALTDFQKGRLIDGSKLPLRTQQAVNLPGLNAQTGAKVQSSVKGMDLQQSAYYYGINPNSEFVVTTKTMLDNRGIKSRFDADAFKGSNENSYWTKKDDGTREVVFNPNASEQTILEEIALHELTHDLMSSDNSNKVLGHENIIDYVSTLPGYKEARAKVEKLYAEQTKKLKTVEEKKAYIDEEVLANTLGKNIGSQEYIRRLIDDEPSIAKNIYDWVVNKVANKNGVKNEKAYWNNVKNNFEKAYNMEYQGKGSKNDAKFAIANTEFANLTPNQQKRFDNAEKLRKEGKSSDEIWYKTGFEYKDSNNSYDFHVEDLKFKKTLNVKTGQAYNIEEVLEGELLDTYPFLRNKEIVMEDLIKDAQKDGVTNTKYLKQLKGVQGATTTDGKLVLNTRNLKSTQEATNVLSHEIQHLIQDYQENGSEETTYFGIDENGNYYTKGATEKDALAAYRNHKNEIEAEVTRVQNAMTKEQRHKYPLSLLINEVSKHYSVTNSSIKPDKFISNLEKKYGQLLDEWYDNGGSDANAQNKIERNTNTNSANITQNESESHKRNNIANLPGTRRGSKNFTNLYVEHSESNVGANDSESNRNTRTQELDNSSFFNEETRYSLSDNKGRELTKKQQEWSKDSKVRDENGNLLTLYHGTPNDNFTIFENKNVGTGAGLMGLKQKGFYFTDRYESAESYSAVKGINENNGVKEVYLNMTNPLVVDTTTESGKQAIRDMFGLRKNAKVTYNFINKYINKMLYDDAINIRSEEQRQEFFNSTGYDGVILKTDLGTDNEYIVFNSNQIKNVDNTKPTTSEDIRYSLSDDQGRELSKGQREYFKDSKVRDENGNLLTMYHASNAQFGEFKGSNIPIYKDRKYVGTESNGLSYFTSDKQYIDGIKKNIKGGVLLNMPYEKQFEKSKPIVYETYLNIKKPLDLTRYNQENTPREWQSILKENGIDLSDQEIGDYAIIGVKYQVSQWNTKCQFYEMIKYATKDFTEKLKNAGFDGIKYYERLMENNVDSALSYITTSPNQIKNVDNLNPTDNADIRYSLSEDASIEDKINASMTMAEAKKMIQIAFQENRINDWREDGEKYADGDDWLNDVGVDEVASYIDNTHSTILNYTNPLYDKNIGFGEDYYTESILEAYQNGTLTGMPKEQATRLDTSISNEYQDDRFYSPREVQATLELYNKANQRITKTNSAEVYKARADFIIATHQKGVAEQLGLTQQEVNKKVKAWANYTEKARNLSNQLNENVSLQNRWSGLENSSIVNTISVTSKDLSKMVKEIKGDSGEWQRQYITSTMLALDTHIDYSKLTFEFDQHQALRAEHALGDYNRKTKTIRIGDGYQNTVAHEIGHYIDNKWAEDFGFHDTANMTNGLNFEATNLSAEAKQFNKNFQAFMDDLVKSATVGYGSKTNYYQSRSEVFARFVGRFVEWTKNQATNNRYGYESKYYEENFTESQYREFVKILQEKAMLDTTMNAEKKHSKQNEGWQSFLDNNFEAKGTKTRLGDIKLPGITNTVQEEVQTEVQKSLLPITNELKELNKNLNKVLNPNEISQLTPQDANTTPILPGINRNQVGDGRSSFFDNINNKVNMLNDEQKAAILSSNDVKYYDKVTNKDSLDKAYARLQENGQSESLRWFNKASESADATDVAEGWILLKHYADSGDTNGMVEVAKKMRQIGSIGGQVIQAFNIMSRLTPEGMVKYAQSELLEAYDQMVKNKSAKWIEDNRSKFDLQPNEVQFIMDTMQEVSTMEDGYDKRFKLAQIQKVLTDKLPPAKGAGMKAWMRISMLFNPKTQVRNVAGNAVIAPVNAFGDMFASLADKVIGAKTGVRTTGNFNLKNYAQGMKTGLYQSYNDFKNGVNTRNIEGNRFEVTEGKSFNDNNAIGKALNRVDSLLSFMLDAGDRGFYEASFVNSINNQMVLNNTTEVTQDMIDIATQEALSRTWQDNNEYTKFVMNVRNGLNKLNIGGYGLGDVLIPFAKTPANLTKAIVEYSPAGLIGTINKGIKLNRSLTNGQYSAKTQHEFVQSLGKATAGTMLYILGIALANAGVTTGESDEDKDVSNFMKNTLGVNSYSIKIGDMSFTYDWAQPLAAPLAITANLVQKQKEEASLLENVVSTLDTAGNLLLEQSFMESISTVLNNNEGVATGMQEAILDLPARAIPTFFKQITDLTDGTQRQTFVKDKPLESMWNSMKAKIPGLSYTLDPSVDTLGREIKKYGGKNNLFNVFLNPANVSTENVSESAQEIYRLYKETGETNIMPRVAPYYVNKKGEKIILSTEERTEYQKISGAIIEENIANLLGSTAYQNMTDTNKAEVINDIVNYSYNIAQNQVLGLELADTYKTAYEYAQIGDISDFYEFRNSIDDTDSTTKRTSIKNYLINSDLDDNQIANLYGNYYSSDKTLNAMLGLRIPMKEFIKFDSEDIQGQYNTNTGQTISGSKKNATIEYVNTLNLSKAQRAILVKSAYSSYKNNDNDIIRYVNTLPGTANEKKVLLKSIGFDAYDDDVFNYINSQNLSKDEKIKKLKELGFTVRDGRVYY